MQNLKFQIWLLLKSDKYASFLLLFFEVWKDVPGDTKPKLGWYGNFLKQNQISFFLQSTVFY